MAVPPVPHRLRRALRHRWPALLVAAITTALVVAVLGPRPPSLADHAFTTGDARLAAQVREILGEGRGHRGLAVAVVEPGGGVRSAGLGHSGDPARPQVDGTTRFEIGSVTKALTGMLLARRVEQGEVALDDRFAGATLEELATHRSGLPRLPAGDVARGAVSNLTGGDPYTGDVASVLAAGLEADPAGGADPAYSNLGAAVLGDLLAEDAGTDYPRLLADEVLIPLGMTSTSVALDPAGLPSPRAVGGTASGRPADPWLAPGWAPAGVGPWSTSEDLAELVAAVAAGTAPGQEAVVPRVRSTGEERIGLLWRTLDVDGHDVVFHNGGTGGFSAFVGVDRTTGRGVVVLANTTRNVDGLALELLTGERP